MPELMRRLIDLVLTDGPDSAIRAIGRELNALGGLPLMQKAYYYMATQIPLGGPDDPHPAIVQGIWDGIGDWRW